MNLLIFQTTLLFFIRRMDLSGKNNCSSMTRFAFPECRENKKIGPVKNTEPIWEF